MTNSIRKVRSAICRVGPAPAQAHHVHSLRRILLNRWASATSLPLVPPYSCCGVFIGLILLSGCGNTAATESSNSPTAYQISSVESTVTVQRVEARVIRSTEEFTGNLLPRRRMQITAQVDGIVAEIPQAGTSFDVEVNGQRYAEQLGIGPGHVVAKGDVLLKIDPTDIQMDVAVAQAKLSKAVADMEKIQAWKRPEEIRQLQAGRDEAQARYKHAAEQLQRTQELAKRNATSQGEVDQKLSDVATSKAVLDSQEAMLALAQSGPTKEEVAVQQALVTQATAELEQKKRELEKTTITAPSDGVVTEFSVEVGDRIGPTSGVIVELLDVRFLIAECGVSEPMLGQVKLKDLADVMLAGVDGVVPGMVVAINGKVDPESRTFRVRVAIDNAGSQFKAGQFARVVFKSGTDSKQPSVPSSALTFVEGQPHVFVVDENSVAHLRSVTVGESDDISVQVTTGVTLGERVIIDDPALVADGLPVKVEEE